MPNTDALLLRIDELLSIHGSTTELGQVYMGTLSLAESLYGVGSPQLDAVKDVGFQGMYLGTDVIRQRIYALHGLLQSMRAEIKGGLVGSIQTQAKGEVLAGFVGMAKWAANEAQKDVAAVLAVAALEDSLKRLAERNGLDVQNKSMSEVVGALKSKGIVQGSQGKVLESFTTIRNRAFHADWNEIHLPEVQSVIAFVEQFLLMNF